MVRFIFLIDENVTFPGFTALLLCIPVAIIINSKDTIVNRILSNKLLVYIGILSYSLYLFHWPILAFYRYLFNFGYEEYSIPVLDGIILLLVIFIVSVFSYYGVEKPFRYKITTNENKRNTTQVGSYLNKDERELNTNRTNIEEK